MTCFKSAFRQVILNLAEAVRMTAPTLKPLLAKTFFLLCRSPRCCSQGVQFLHHALPRRALACLVTEVNRLSLEKDRVHDFLLRAIGSSRANLFVPCEHDCSHFHHVTQSSAVGLGELAISFQEGEHLLDCIVCSLDPCHQVFLPTFESMQVIQREHSRPGLPSAIEA